MSVEIDHDLAAEVGEILGTTSLSETIRESMNEIINLRKQQRLVELLAEPDRLDFDGVERASGNDDSPGSRSADG